MLTLTPHIIRTPDVTEADLMPIWVGTEANISFRGGVPRVESDVEGPFDEGGSAADAEEKLREQVQRLPRGLRESRPPGQQQPTEATPQPGVNLVPGSAPNDPFAPQPAKPEPPEEEPPDSGALSPGAAGESLDLVAGYPASAVVGAGEAVRLRLEPATLAVQPGASFDVEIEIAATAPVGHLPMTLSYDPTLLAVEQVVAGDFLGGSKNAQVTADTSTPGELVLGASRVAGAAGVAGHGSIALVRFRALAEGDAEVEIAAVRAMDPDLSEVAGVAVESSRIAIADLTTAEAAAPEDGRDE
jgi:general secretion pathway protein D